MNKIKVIDNNRIFDNLMGFIEYLQFVKAHFKDNDSLSILELGSFIGKSTSLIAEHFSKSDITAIDTWVNDFDNNDPICAFDFNVAENMFDKNTKFNYNIAKVKLSSVEAVTLFKDNTLDVVYIDANHNYKSCLEDLELWIPKIKKSGILSGHDYVSSGYSGVTQALEKLQIVPDKIFIDSSWVKVL